MFTHFFGAIFHIIDAQWQGCIPSSNKAVYTNAPVAGGWAGAVMIWAGALMIWAGAVMIWAGACSKKNYPTLKMPKNAKKAKCDGRTDRPTDTVTYRSRARDKNERKPAKSLESS